MKFKYIAIIIIILILLCLNMRFVEDNEKDSKDIVIEFIDKNVIIENITGFTYEGETNVTFIDMNIINITKINFTLKWIDNCIDYRTRLGIPVNELDLFDLEFIAPKNSKIKYIKHNMLDEENDTGYVFINVYFNNFLNNDSIEEFYVYSFHPNLINTIGCGIWQLNITCLDAPGYRTECLWPFKTEDEGNSWTIFTDVRYYYSNQYEK